MSFNNSKVQSLINKIKSQILGDIEDKIEEHDVVANSSRTGHVQAGSSPQDINTSGTSNAGTDNGYYARADHVHKIATASTTGKGIVQLDSTPTANSSNGVTSGGVKSAIPLKTSDLTNDSGYINSSSLDEYIRIDNLKNYIKLVYNHNTGELELKFYELPMILVWNAQEINNINLIGNNVTIDYGDGTIEQTNILSHTYSTTGEHTITIEGITSIGDYTFEECNGLISINIPRNITSIEESCFRYCNNLSSINIPNSVTSIGRNCFRSCGSLASINIPNTVTSIGDTCFRECVNLTSIILNWTTSSQIIQYNSNWITNENANLKFIIPTGTTSLYTAKSYPSDKLVEIN